MYQRIVTLCDACFVTCYYFSLRILNVWHPVSFFKVNSFDFILNWIPFHSRWSIEEPNERHLKILSVYFLNSLYFFIYCWLLLLNVLFLLLILFIIREIGNDTKPYRRHFICSFHLNDENDTVFLSFTAFDRFICFTLWQ